MGWDLCGNTHSSLWSFAGALLVSSTREAVEWPMFTDHLYQVLALGFLVGCTFAPNLKTFAGQ